MENIKYKIVVRGGYGLTNFGDDALLKSLHDDYFYKFSTEDLAYSCTYQDYLTKYIQGYDILPLDTDYSSLTDLLVYGGGTQFYSFSKNSFKEKLINNANLIFNPIKLLKKINSVLNRNQNKLTSGSPRYLKKIAIGIGVGPFLSNADPAVEMEVKMLFKNMDFVAVRDVYSLKKCTEWQVENYGMYSDLCFKMTHPLFFKSYPTADEVSVKTIGIIVRDWNRTKEGNSYRDSLMKFVNKIDKAKYSLEFFVFAKDKDKGWIDFLNSENVSFHLWDPNQDTFDYYLNKLNKVDIFITARYHGAIFSAMLGKPFITIEVEQKLKMISELFKKGSFCWKYPFKQEVLDTYVENITHNYLQYSQEVTKTAEIQRDSANKMYMDMMNILNKK